MKVNGEEFSDATIERLASMAAKGEGLGDSTVELLARILPGPNGQVYRDALANRRRLEKAAKAGSRPKKTPAQVAAIQKAFAKALAAWDAAPLDVAEPERRRLIWAVGRAAEECHSDRRTVKPLVAPQLLRTRSR